MSNDKLSYCPDPDDPANHPRDVRERHADDDALPELCSGSGQRYGSDGSGLARCPLCDLLFATVYAKGGLAPPHYPQEAEVSR